MNSDAEDLLVVLVTFPSLEVARDIGTRLVESHLAACVNLFPAIESIYRWQGSVEQSAEVLAIFKTLHDQWPEFESQLQRLHPYEVPEVIALPPAQVSQAYAKWVAESVMASRSAQRGATDSH